MLHLYYKPYCPYCVRLLKANETLQVPLQLRDISADPAARAELIAKGGKQQVPFLEDTERGVVLYESLDIMEYLKKHYMPSAAEVRWDEVGNVCPID